MSASDDKMLPFSRFAARLSRGRRIRRGDTLLDTPDPQAAVRALPVDEFYYLVAERGLPEAQDLLLLGSPEQVQLVVDLQAWDKDRFSLAKAEPWLAALIEAPPEQVYEWVRGLDVELVALLMRRRVKLYDLTMGEEPDDDAEGQYIKTPDGFFMIDALGSPDEQRVTRSLLEALYSVDLNYARRVLVALQSELDSDLEEQSLRWRAGRLADLGFVDYYEALEVYAPLDPNSVNIGESNALRVRPLVDQKAVEGARSGAADALRMPTSLVETLASRGSRFTQAIGRVQSDEELAELHAALVALANRVLAADRVTPGDEAGMSLVFSRLQGLLDVALEYLARGDDEKETAAVRTVPLVRLFRLGVSLVAKVGKLASALVKESPFAQLSQALALWEAEDEEALRPLLEPRPSFPRVLDTKPGSGSRAFVSLADIARATMRLEQMAAQLALLVALGVRPQHLAPQSWPTLGIRDPHAMDTGRIARTILVHRLIGSTQPGLVALSRADIAAFTSLGFDVRERALETLRAAVRATAPAASVLPPAAEAVAERWARSLVPLQPVLVTAPAQ